MLLILYLNVGTVMIVMSKMTYLVFSTYLSYFGIFFIVSYITYKVITEEKLKIKDIVIILLCIFGFISYCNAIDEQIAWVGTLERNEGLRILITYYFIYLVASTTPKNFQKKIMYVFLITGIFQIIVGTIQTLGILNIFGYDRSYNWSTMFKFASGTVGNPNFYSIYILLCLMYCYGNLIKAKTKTVGVIYFILTVIFIYGLVIGDTLSCFMAFFTVVIITLIKKINKKNIGRVCFVSILIVIFAAPSIVILNNQLNGRVFRTIQRDLRETQEILENGITDETGNNRIYIWRKTLEFVPANIFTGIGIDNFSFVNDGDYLCAGKGEIYECFDKAHNEYLQKLITEGIFSILTYLFLLGYSIYKFYESKNHSDNHFYGLFLSFIAYLIQAFLNISVITVAPFFYMIMGFLNMAEKDRVPLPGE